MKHLMSINYKFMEISPKDLVELTNEVDGYELYIRFEEQKEIDYMKALAYECKIHNKLFQIHGNSELNIEDQFKFMDLLETISDNLENKINVVLHSVYNEEKNLSKELTKEYLNKVTEYVNNNKIQITLENLNDVGYIDRLNKDEIIDLICNNDNVYFTYDIGHEIDDNGNLIELPDYLIDLLRNIHIHTYNKEYDDGFDHKAIYKGDPHWDQILKTLLFIKNIKYEGPIVYEYAINTCPGDTLEEKIKSYIESIKFVMEHLK